MITLQAKTLLLTETAGEQNLSPKIVLRAAQRIEADIVFLRNGRIDEGEAVRNNCRVRNCLEAEDVWLYQAGVFLNPSLKTLSKFVHIIVDDRCMEVLFEFLMCEKPLFFPCVEENPAFRGLPAALRRKAEELLKEAERMGAHIAHSPLGQTRETAICQSMLVTEETVAVLPKGQTLEVLDQAIITPLAWDQIHQKKIHIRRRRLGG